jgi:hypothetical protein
MTAGIVEDTQRAIAALEEVMCDARYRPDDARDVDPAEARHRRDAGRYDSARPGSGSSITCSSCSPRHGAFDLTLKVDGDLDVDQHHTVEDVGIALGEAVGRRSARGAASTAPATS